MALQNQNEKLFTKDTKYRI